MSAPWPMTAHLRGLLVALHVLAVTLAALPSPEGGMNRGAWTDPTVQAEFAAWRGRLAALGIELSAEELEDRLWTLAQGWMAARKASLAPFAPYYRHMGTAQPWRMFVAPHTHPSRLHIELLEGEEWRTLYIARDPRHRWKAELLDHDRMRSALFRYAWPGYRRSWEELGRWLADRAAEEFPAGARLRLFFTRARTPSPEEARRGVRPAQSTSQALQFDLGGRRGPR